MTKLIFLHVTIINTSVHILRYRGVFKILGIRGVSENYNLEENQKLFAAHHGNVFKYGIVSLLQQERHLGLGKPLITLKTTTSQMVRTTHQMHSKL